MNFVAVRILLVAVSLAALAPTPLAKGRDDSARSSYPSVEGIVRAWNPAARTFRVTDEGRTYLVRATTRTVFAAEHRGRLSAGQFWARNRSGQKVDVTPAGGLGGSTVVALQIRLDD